MTDVRNCCTMVVDVVHCAYTYSKYTHVYTHVYTSNILDLVRSDTRRTLGPREGARFWICVYAWIQMQLYSLWNLGFRRVRCNWLREWILEAMFPESLHISCSLGIDIGQSMYELRPCRSGSQAVKLVSGVGPCTCLPKISARKHCN